MDKFQNKYRISSARLQNWDYGWNASYFITICTHNRQCFFGKIIDEKMELSEIGETVKHEWLKTFEMRPDMNLTSGEYIIMPNHFHAIITIGKNQYNTPNYFQNNGPGIRRDAMHCDSTVHTHITNTNECKIKNGFRPQSKNLASIIRGFKTGVTRSARIIDPSFTWQSRYYDHIIRDEKSYNNITKYIINNPLNWKKDNDYV